MTAVRQYLQGLAAERNRFIQRRVVASSYGGVNAEIHGRPVKRLKNPAFLSVYGNHHRSAASSGHSCTTTD